MNLREDGHVRSSDYKAIRRGVEAWREYVESRLAEDVLWRADLTHVRLPKRDLSGAVLTGANLAKANLSKANLTGADLSKANLTGANLSGANLRDARLARAVFSGADLSGSRIGGGKWSRTSDCTLSGANLSGADLSGARLFRWALREADLSGANLGGAIFHHWNLMEATLRGANLAGTDLRGSDLTGADLTGADLSGAMFGPMYEGYQGANLKYANLVGANLAGANLQRVNLRHAQLNGANLVGANLQGADLTGAELRDANLTGALGPPAKAEGVDLTGANLTGVITGPQPKQTKTGPTRPELRMRITVPMGKDEPAHVVVSTLDAIGLLVAVAEGADLPPGRRSEESEVRGVKPGGDEISIRRIRYGSPLSVDLVEVVLKVSVPVLIGLAAKDLLKGPAGSNLMAMVMLLFPGEFANFLEDRELSRQVEAEEKEAAIAAAKAQQAASELQRIRTEQTLLQITTQPLTAHEIVDRLTAGIEDPEAQQAILDGAQTLAAVMAKKLTITATIYDPSGPND